MDDEKRTTCIGEPALDAAENPAIPGASPTGAEAYDDDDRALAALFGAFDDVHAAEGLKESTLAVILAAAGEDADDDGPLPEAKPFPDAEPAGRDEPAKRAESSEQDSAATGENPFLNPKPLSDAVPTERGPVAAGGSAPGADGAPASPPEASVIAFDDARAAAEGRRSKSARGASRRFRLPQVAAAACLALALGGGVAYAVPSAQVTVEEDGSAITLDVNVFGRTIGAHADGDEGEELLAGLDVRHMGYEESLGRILDAFGERPGGEGDVRIEVDGGLGMQSDDMRSGVQRVMDAHPAPQAEAPQGGGGSVPPGMDAQAGNPQQPTDAPTGQQGDGFAPQADAGGQEPSEGAWDAGQPAQADGTAPAEDASPDAASTRQDATEQDARGSGMQPQAQPSTPQGVAPDGRG